MNAVRKVVLISDTHVGSEYAIWPPGITSNKGAAIPQNKLQRKLYKFWQEDCRAADDYGADTVIHFGDVVEGSNRKDGGKLLTAVSIDKQTEAFCELSKPLVRGRKFYAFVGSGYHHSIDTDIIDDIVKGLYTTEAKSAENLGSIAFLDIAGVRLYCRHGADSAVIYTSRKLEAEIKDAMVQQARDIIPKVDIILRGHLHTYNHVEKFGIHSAILPAWKTFAPDRIHLKNPMGMMPDIGMVFLTIYDDGAFAFIPKIHKLACEELSDILVA